MTVRALLSRAMAGLIFCAVCAGVGLPPARSEDRARQGQQPFKIAAKVVRVDVLPTKDGLHVGDLSLTDFEVFEDGVPQTIDLFQHIVDRGRAEAELRREPATVAESLALARDPNTRVFVLFLDTGHVSVTGSHDIRDPLVESMGRLLGADDLVAVMKPGMAPGDVAFGHVTTTIEDILRRYWTWGDRARLVVTDPVEQHYEDCYGTQQNSRITAEMIARRREQQTIETLRGLTAHLGDLREERKSVIVLTDGWRLYGPSAWLDDVATPPRLRIGMAPARGGFSPGRGDTTPDPRSADCERDRHALAALDDRESYRRLTQDARRANVAFYLVPPARLSTIENTAGRPPAATVDGGLMNGSEDTLRSLAEQTGGIAVIGNDLASGLQRVLTDTRAYYLLGYSSNRPLDGKFHAIRVRVKRPNVVVRARPGYMAAPVGTPDAAPSDVSAGRSRAAESAGLAAVLASLNQPENQPLRTVAAAGWRGGHTPTAFVCVVGEMGRESSFKPPPDGDGDVEISLLPVAGGTAVTERTTIANGARLFRATLSPVKAGDYRLRTIVHGALDTGPLQDTIAITVPDTPEASGVMVFRKGPSTGNREAATADMRFHRDEQIRVDVAAASSLVAGAQLLDRNGVPLPIPVASTTREDADRSRWHSAQLPLAPLGNGDYIIELRDGTRRTLVAFRVIR